MTMEPKLPNEGLLTVNNETTTTTTTKPIHPSPPLPPPPPRLHFDDGIRQTNHNVTYNSSVSTSDNNISPISSSIKTSIYEYYEIERLVSEIHTISRNIATSTTVTSTGTGTIGDRTNSKIQSTTTVAATTTTPNPSTTDTILMIRIAIQLPDELLHDAPDLCWEYETALQLLSVPNDDDDNDTHIQYYVFILGDTTYASCCPDIIAAQHINAHILIHYGHACLSHLHMDTNHCNNTTSTTTTTTKSVSNSENSEAKEQNQFPIILYSFGRKPISISQCVHDVVDELQNKNSNSNDRDHHHQQLQRILLLYEVQYAYAMDELCTTLQTTSNEMNGQQHLTIKMGKIPQLSSTSFPNQPTTMTATTLTNKNCCSNGILNSNSSNDNHNCCKKNTDTETIPSSVTSYTNVHQTTTYENSTRNDEMIKQYHRIMVGGLELPYPFSNSNMSNTNVDDDNDDEWKRRDDNMTNDYILLYIGDVTSRPFLNIVLRFLSDTSSTQPYNLSSIWTWSPSSDHKNSSNNSKSLLCSNVLQNSIEFQRILQRRYYLIQKAKHCTTFGIIVAHMTKQIQQFISSIEQFLNQKCNNYNNISYYTFVVGKINPMKLTNFPEIDCFVLVACPEHTLLQNEREMYPIPIITPYELLVAFSSNSQNEWGSIPYSTYPNDYWTVQNINEEQPMENYALDGVTNQNNEDDDDAPYFSMVTGKYESRTNVNSTTATVVSDHTNKNDDNNNDMTTLVTKSDGTMIQYETNKNLSVASTFLKQRAYQGLVVMAPSEIQTLENNTDHDNNREDDDSNYNIIVQPAILGQTGIASKYGNR